MMKLEIDYENVQAGEEDPTFFTRTKPSILHPPDFGAGRFAVPAVLLDWSFEASIDSFGTGATNVSIACNF